ncbi:MAG: ABC transporter permease [Vibrio sp.]
MGKFFAVGLISIIFMPLIPGLYWMVMDILYFKPLNGIIEDIQTVPAIIATLNSTIISVVLSLVFALFFSIKYYPFKTWNRAVYHLPILLAVPHVVFAIGFIFLFSPTGWISRIFAYILGYDTPPNWFYLQDYYGISLGIALAIKESFFLLWVITNLLNEQKISLQITIAHSMGYHRKQIWWSIILPQILPKMVWPFIAVIAYSLSVVDMALILGPTTPPTFAVLIWQWITDPDPQIQVKGSLGAFLLLIMLIITCLLLRITWWLYRRWKFNFNGKRETNKAIWLASFYRLGVWICFMIIGLVFLWSFSDGWFFPAVWPNSITIAGWLQADFIPLQTSLWLGFISSIIALIIVLIWLEWGPQHHYELLYIPLFLPAIPLSAAQYFVLLSLNLDRTSVGLVWSHLLWVLPYTLLSLVGAYRQFDPRLVLTGRALGYSNLMCCIKIKWPLLLRSILAALALGFVVSVMQYLPTLFAGAGRFSSVATEAVALSSSGNRRTIAVQAVLQMLLPMMAFLSVAVLNYWRGKKRRGLR